MRPPSRRLGPPTARGTPGLRGHAGCPASPRWPDRRSCRHEVGLECLDRYLDRRVGLLAPQFARGEDDCIEPLRILAGADRGSVGKDVAPAHRLDYAELTAGIAREAGMRRRMDFLVLTASPALKRAGPGAGRSKCTKDIAFASSSVILRLSRMPGRNGRPAAISSSPTRPCATTRRSSPKDQRL